MQGNGSLSVEIPPIHLMPAASDDIALASAALAQYAYDLDPRPGLYDLETGAD